jgi:hypothetical protein
MAAKPRFVSCAQVNVPRYGIVWQVWYGTTRTWALGRSKVKGLAKQKAKDWFDTNVIKNSLDISNDGPYRDLVPPEDMSSYDIHEEAKLWRKWKRDKEKTEGKKTLIEVDKNLL